MPYKSKAQLRFMHSQHPEIARKWDKKYAISENLPERVENKQRSKTTPRVKGGSIHGKRKD